MSLKSLLTLVDDKLEAIFHRKEPDATSLRAKALKAVETTKKQIGSIEPPRGKRSFKINNQVVAYSPTVGGHPLKIGGKETVYVPAERFPDFLDNLTAAIEAGEFDAELINPASTASPTVSTKGKRGPRGPLSPEKLAERRAKMAAKK